MWAPMRQYLPFMKNDPFVAVIRLQGAISNQGRGLDDAGMGPVIEKAFAKGKPKAIALQINSPGGSAVQSSLIAARIRRLSEEKEIPVYAFVEDVAASGGYWLATAADEIIVDATPVVGSIGVISAGFGLHELIDRYGIERRVHTAGTSKSILDPFRPEKAEDVDRLKRILEQIHASFIAQVKTRRKGKLDLSEDLFNGEIWVGAGAIEVGLADDIGHLVPLMKKKFGDKVKFRKYGQRRGLFQRLGAEAINQASFGIEERAAFARFGL